MSKVKEIIVPSANPEESLEQIKAALEERRTRGVKDIRDEGDVSFLTEMLGEATDSVQHNEALRRAINVYSPILAR